MSGLTVEQKEQCVAEMTAGSIFNGYFPQGEAVVKRQVFVFYEADGGKGSFWWNILRDNKDEKNSLPLERVTDVYPGNKGPLFSSEAAQTAVVANCFALSSKGLGKSLHLEAPMEGVRKQWLDALKEAFMKKGQECEGVSLMATGGLFTAYLPAEEGIRKVPVFVWLEDTEPSDVKKCRGTVYWQELRVQLGEEFRLPLATITDVYPNKKHPVMQSEAAKDAAAPLCLSVYSKKTEKGLHLEAYVDQTKKNFLAGLQHLFSRKKTPESVLSPRSEQVTSQIAAAQTPRKEQPVEKQQEQPAIELVSPAQQQPTPEPAPAAESAPAPAPVIVEAKRPEPPKPEPKVELPPPQPLPPARPVLGFPAGSPGTRAGAAIRVDLSDGPKLICRCGQSNNYPFADDTCAEVNKRLGTNLCPYKLDRVSFGQNHAYICGCGYSKGIWAGRPFADGCCNGDARAE